MSHTIKDQKKLLARVRRIKGQAEALERALENGGECSAILQQIAAVRGAVNGLMAQVLEGHVREHLTAEEIRQVLADSGHTLAITDLHLGRIGKGKYQCVLALSSADNALTADRVRQLLAIHDELVHITVEINRPPLAQGVVLFRQNSLA